MPPPQRHDQTKGTRKHRPDGEIREAFELLRAKLDVPPPRPGLVERTATRRPPLPRAQRSSRQRRRTPWLRQDDGPRAVGGTRPSRIRLGLARPPRQRSRRLSDVRRGGIERRLDGRPRSVQGAQRAPATRCGRVGVPRLVAALAARPEPLVLVLDDVHELENHECLDALAALLLHVPRGSQLVLSGRAEARLGLPKLRADGELLELGPAALALNDAEAHALLDRSRSRRDQEPGRSAERACGGLGRRFVSRGPLAGRRQLVSRVVRRRRPLRHGLPAGRGAQPRRAARSSSSCSGQPCSSRCALRCATRCSSATTRRRCSSSWSARTCSSSLSTTSAAGSATTICSGRCSRRSSERREPELPLTLNRRAAAWCVANGQPEVAIEYSVAAGDTD